MNGEHQYSSFFPIFALYISAESPRVGKDMCIIYGEDVYKRLAFGFQNFAPFDLSKEQMATGNVLVVCIFTYCPFLSGKGHAVYISAWAFSVVHSKTAILICYLLDYQQVHDNANVSIILLGDKKEPTK